MEITKHYMADQQFIYHSILDINARLAKFQQSVIIFHAGAIDVFTFLCAEFSIVTVFSYQESGVRYTWNQDKQVARLLQEKKVQWVEFQRDGIVRGIKNRNAWDK
jgi:deoxyribodipyrimidine photo-lyase